MNIRLSLCAAAAAFAFFCSAPAVAGPVNIIPAPVSIVQKSGEFTLSPSATIGYGAGLEEYADYLEEILSTSTGYNIKSRPGKGTVTLVIDSAKVTKPEGYTLNVTPKGISITGADRGGLFYGIQSLLQLFPAQIYSDKPVKDIVWTAPEVSIADAPERPWRGMMLDVARYFHDKDYVKHYIDMMAMYKLNKLQFHLIDDSGWRLEIKKYPRLTEVGAYAGPEHNKLGGYYTQEDIKEIIDYGRLRNVEIIPEIEFPAHILSAIVAYPWLSCTGLQHELPRQHFISRDLLCVGKQSSIDFLRDVLDETVALFPSKYINIGGDEAVYTRWESCPDCQALMKKEGLTKASELQGWLTNVVAKMMAEKDRTVIGWEEIITRGKVDTPVVALIWHNVADSAMAVPDGHKAILTPATHMYLDFPESSTPGEIKAAGWMPPISVEKCYSMPVNDYSPESTVIGVQGCLWSDQFIHGTVLQELPQINENRSENYVDYLTFPRLLAVAEVAWSKESARNYDIFKSRLSDHYTRLDQKGAVYRLPEPEIASMTESADGVTFTLTNPLPGSEIRYTTDGTYPTVHSPLYTGTPVKVASKADFHASTVVDGKRMSLPIHFAPDYSAYACYGKLATEWGPLQVQPKQAPWSIDATGKISGNGDYEVTFIPLKGAAKLHLGNLRLMKRNEQLASIEADNTLGSEPVQYSFSVSEFEAGTPFTIVVDQWGEGSNDSSGLVFIRKKD
jgi:hexosaminidase